MPGDLILQKPMANTLCWQGALFHKLNLDANKVDPITISHTFRRNLAGEFGQMFEEAWAQMEENFYDETFRGLDWAKIKTRYQAFVPQANTRQDIRVLLNDMLGELKLIAHRISILLVMMRIFNSPTVRLIRVLFSKQKPLHRKTHYSTWTIR
jgi:hypothetical protein